MDLIYYYIIWIDNRSKLLEADTRWQEGKYPMIKVLQGCILKLSLHSHNTVLILYRTGNMQSAILLSFIASSSLPPCGLQLTHPLIPSYISPYVVHNVSERNTFYTLFVVRTNFVVLSWFCCGSRIVCSPLKKL